MGITPLQCTKANDEKTIREQYINCLERSKDTYLRSDVAGQLSKIRAVIHRHLGSEIVASLKTRKIYLHEIRRFVSNIQNFQAMIPLINRYNYYRYTFILSATDSIVPRRPSQKYLPTHLDDHFLNYDFYRFVLRSLQDPNNIIPRLAIVIQNVICLAYFSKQQADPAVEEIKQNDVSKQIFVGRDLLKEVIYTFYEFFFKYNAIRRPKDPHLYAECLANTVLFNKTHGPFNATLGLIRETVHNSRKNVYEQNFNRNSTYLAAQGLDTRSSISTTSEDNPINKLINKKLEELKAEWNPHGKLSIIRSIYADVDEQLRKFAPNSVPQSEDVERELLNVFNSKSISEVLFDFQWVELLGHVEILNDPCNFRYHNLKFLFDTLYNTTMKKSN